MRRLALAILAAACVAAAAPPATAATTAPAPPRTGAHTLRPAPPRAPAAAGALGSGITGSKHDLSVTGPGPVKAVSETRVCIFCHVSHAGAPGGGNRPVDQPAEYRAYSSSTLSSPPTAAARASRVCLSCHDGTIAVGRTLASGNIAMRTGDAPLAPGSKAVLGTDLRRSHPIAVRPALRANLKRPLAGDPVQLDHSGTVECTSCHDPHREDRDPTLRKFLVKPGARSALCSSCHVMDGWNTNPSAHQSSMRPVEAVPAGSPYRTINEAGCATCHDSHGGSERGWLLKDGSDAAGDGLCLRCHDGRVARLDVAADVRKPFAHLTAGASAVHDPAEGPTSAVRRLPEAAAGAARHVTCVDCHDPHAAYALPARPPVVSGALAGVWGVDRNGLAVPAVRFEYEVCFKCHGDSANQPQARGPSLPETLRRATTEVNLRRVFDASAASSHPVVAPGRGATVPSLVASGLGTAAPLSSSSQITCGDCHASDSGPGAGGLGPRGPHGSSFPHLLERNYATADGTPESPQAYALCYKCHAREVLLCPPPGDATPPADQVCGAGGASRRVSTFPLHASHVKSQSTPCSACHASHGVSSVQGNPINNAHLVDFDVSIVRANKSGVRQYVSRGTGSGSCALACHGHEHDGVSSVYGPGLGQALRVKPAGQHGVRAAPPRR